MAIKPHKVNDVKPSFNFIIPTYNSGENLHKCLSSIIAQEDEDWKAIVIDDCSTDSSISIVRDMIHEDNRLTLLSMPKNMGACYSRYRGIHSICEHPEDVCMLVDGDDWLINNEALDIIKLFYSNGAEATHGSHVDKYGSSSGMYGHYSEEVQRNNSYRNHEWIIQHPRTFRYKYFLNIPPHQFKDDENNWIDACTDLAIMYPILEQIPFPGFRYINASLYCYYNTLRNRKRFGADYKNRIAKMIRMKTPQPFESNLF